MMKKQIFSRVLLALLALLMVLTLVACADVDKTGDWETATYVRDKEFGDGEKTITLKVIADGQELTFTINTDKETLEDALVEHQLIDGDQDAYGMYVKKVNGIVADYDTDKTYWALSKSGVETMTGVTGTIIADGDCYELTKTVSQW